MLAKDERLGLAIAALVGALALASYVYRHTRSSSSEPDVQTVQAAPPIDDPAARQAYAALLERAFVQDQNPAKVIADGTTLAIEWEMCSKQMIQRLLHDDQNYQVMNIRQLSGLSAKRLKTHGFKQVTCFDGRKNLAPAVHKL
jgi:hypothetical protein